MKPIQRDTKRVEISIKRRKRCVTREDGCRGQPVGMGASAVGSCPAKIHEKLIWQFMFHPAWEEGKEIAGNEALGENILVQRGSRGRCCNFAKSAARRDACLRERGPRGTRPDCAHPVMAGKLRAGHLPLRIGTQLDGPASMPTSKSLADRCCRTLSSSFRSK